MDNPEKKQNLATFGQETFKIGGDEKVQDDQVVLNIQEEIETSPIVLEKRRGMVVTETGNPLIDLYHKINLYFIKKSSVTVEIKANFFHLLSVMINAGMPMIKALNSLSVQIADRKMQLILITMAQDITEGLSLSRSMVNNPDVFTEQEIGMIQAGEASGQLSKVLEVVAHDTEKSSSIRKKIKSAMMYPIVIFVLLISVIVVMLVFVIPKLTDLFSSVGGELPLITKIIVGMSDFLLNKKYILIGIVVVIVIAFLIFRKTEKGKYIIDDFKIRVPIFGILFKKAYLSRFARSLSNLLDSSVTIIKTIEITANSIGNEVYRQRLLLSLEDIKQGIPLAENLTESSLFPPMLVSMIEVGEKTAQLDVITAKIADFYEQEVDTAVAGLSKLIEPIILVIIGLTVGAVVAAIMLPIMKLSSVAGTI